MLVKIKAYFQSRLTLVGGVSGEAKPPSIELATAALLIEVSRADAHLDAAEKQSVVQALIEQFQLPAADIDELVRLAEDEVEEAISLYQFTRLVNENYAYEQKLQLIEAMWRVAFADGELDKYEDYLVRKVADLIYVSHTDFIRCKLRVAEAGG